MEHPVTDLADLPYDIFLSIVAYLSPSETLLCRRVSRAWSVAFRGDHVSWSFMRWHFPRTREMKRAAQAQSPAAWSHAWHNVISRHHRLANAEAKMIEKISLAPIGKQDHWFREVEPWDRRLEFGDGTNNTPISVAIFQYGNPDWCLDDGLLIYREGGSNSYIAYDLEMGRRFPVPFRVADKTIRRLRLAQNILIFEWCKRTPSPLVNNRHVFSSHFVTVFDVPRPAEPASCSNSTRPWEIRLRFEWEIHSEIGRHDRFFSAHTATHYALYLWQQGGLCRPDDDLSEQLTIWDITDATSEGHSHGRGYSQHLDVVPRRPKAIKKFTSPDLEFLHIRQGQTPKLRDIFLDELNLYVHEEDHHWLRGRHVSQNARPRLHDVCSTGIPLTGVGPRWFDKCSADGDDERSFCPRAGSARRVGGRKRAPGHVIKATWLGWAPCWRHEDLPNTTLSEVVDADAGVRIAARQCFDANALTSFVRPAGYPESATGAEGEEDEAYFEDDLWRQLLGKGVIAGDERWVVGEDGRGAITVVRF
ncbi:hypothetical protein F4861DRAFT_85778 [Xylaria intraflava]|nr:hypothetical protein F4861DRAFT_85778 [Xylaria intraflava]